MNKRKLLSGNYDLEKNPDLEIPEKAQIPQFEEEVLKHLGGSIAFVRKGKLYDDNQ